VPAEHETGDEPAGHADEEAEEGRLDRGEEQLPERHPHVGPVEPPEARPDRGGATDEEGVEEVDDPGYALGDGRQGQPLPETHAEDEDPQPPEVDPRSLG